MANHPQPGQAEPQPSDPWQDAPLWGGGPDATGAPYGEPSVHIADPYSPPTGYPAASPAPVWGPPTPPAKKGLSTMAITLITAAAVTVVGGAAIGGYALTQGNSKPSASKSSSTGPSGGSSPSASASASPSSTERDLHTAKVGDCLLNRGSKEDPKLDFVSCSSQGALKVVARYDNTDDDSLCDKLPDADLKFYNSRPAPKFVLCLKRL